MVSILQGVKVSIFPIGNSSRRYNSAALPRSLWWTKASNIPGILISSCSARLQEGFCPGGTFVREGLRPGAYARAYVRFPGQPV